MFDQSLFDITQVDFLSISIFCFCVYLLLAEEITCMPEARQKISDEIDSISELSFHSDSTMRQESESEPSLPDIAAYQEFEAHVNSELAGVQDFSPDANQVFEFGAHGNSEVEAMQYFSPDANQVH